MGSRVNGAYLSVHDYLVRVPASHLGRIVLEHLLTEQDAQVLELAFPPARRPRGRAGLTEWEGRIDGCLVSLAWDWLELDDGRLQVLPLPVRSNLMLLDERGYDLPREVCEPLLLGLIGRTPWQREVHAALAEAAALQPPAAGPSGAWPAWH